MIRYNLTCPKQHLFEAWFNDSAGYETQAAAGQVRCPACGSKKVTKAPMAPAVAGGRARRRDQGREQGDAAEAAKLRGALRELRAQVEANCDYVGPTFAEEARKIHYGEVEQRNIYGETSDNDAKALKDEGIEVQRIPWLPRENS